MTDIQIIYTKEGIKIIHPSGANQFITLEELHRLWDYGKKREKEAERFSEHIHDYILEVEKLQ